MVLANPINERPHRLYDNQPFVPLPAAPSTTASTVKLLLAGKNLQVSTHNTISDQSCSCANDFANEGDSFLGKPVLQPQQAHRSVSLLFLAFYFSGRYHELVGCRSRASFQGTTHIFMLLGARACKCVYVCVCVCVCVCV